MIKSICGSIQKNIISMLKRLFSQQELTKSQRQHFVPFVNERNFMGALISDSQKSSNRRRRDNQNRDLEIIQNLTKTTKQYLFDKKYKKMVSKLMQIQESMQTKQANYDREIDHCLKTLTSSGFRRAKDASQKHYVDFKQELNNKMQQKKMYFLNILNKKKQTNSGRPYKPLQLSEQFEQGQKMRQTRYSSAKKESRCRQAEPRIKKSIFQQVGNKSEFMADVTNSAIKYREMVQSKKINPWKKWYTKEEIQLFPGSKIIVTKLQKSIY